MNKNILIIITILFVVINCKNIQFGQHPSKLDKNLPYIKGKIHFKEEDLILKYVITSMNNKDNNDLIFYFHGIGRTEFEWVEENGFGMRYYDELKKNPDFKNNPVVSISLGSAFLLIDDVPAPYNADIEKLFINKIVPYFKNLLNCSSKVYLIGHSMGGYNALAISLRHPDKFPVIAVISPFVAPISPFRKKFREKGEDLKMPKAQIDFLENLLTKAFVTEEKWNEYSPYILIQKNQGENTPYIIISTAENDLPGFESSIDDFTEILKNKNIDHFFCKTKGDHKSTCETFFYKFFEKISLE